MTLDQKILELVKKYMGKLAQKKVLTSMEEVEANTNETNLVGAPVVAELNNNLSKKANQSDLQTITTNLQNQIDTKAKFGDENLADGYFDIIGTTGSHDCIFRIWTTKKQLEAYIKPADHSAYKQVWIGTFN